MQEVEAYTPDADDEALIHSLVLEIMGEFVACAETHGPYPSIVAYVQAGDLLREQFMAKAN